MIVNISKVWSGVAHKHVEFINKCIDDFFYDFYFGLNVPAPHELKVASFLHRNREKIASPNMVDYRKIIRSFDGNFPDKSTLRSLARVTFEKIFDYDSFKNKTKKGWNAYTLCAGAKQTICPYCHMAGTETEVLDEDGKGYRPQLDHYFGKATYPFLALSLGNLIPCCARCNGVNFKHQIDFSKIPHLDPLRDKENIYFTFRCKNEDMEDDPIISAFRGSVDNYVIRVNGLVECNKTNSSINTFQLNKIYAQYVGEARRISSAVRYLFEKEKLGGVNSRKEMLKDAIGIELDSFLCISFDANSPGEYKNVLAGKMQLDVFRTAIKKLCE